MEQGKESKGKKIVRKQKKKFIIMYTVCNDKV